jgi:methylenetetrahydrofolate reductase (NADPH)
MLLLAINANKGRQRMLQTVPGPTGLASETEPSASQAGLTRIAQDLTIEINPRDMTKHVDALGLLPKGMRVFVTRLPKGSFDESLAASSALSGMGLKPVPHMTARTTLSLADLERQLAQLTMRAGVEEILLIAGSVEPQGAFADTLPIFGSDVLQSAGLKRVFVAGHPESHPDVEEAELHRALMLKNEFSARTGLPIEIVTQFFFDAAPIIAWERRIRSEGNRLAVHAGLHGVAGIAGLMKHAVACGVGASLKVLAARASNIFQLATMHAPDDLAQALAHAIEADPGSLFGHVHMFPLGGLARSIGWANALREGRYHVANGALKIGD